ncbi:MAG: hypothetical protein LBE55_03480 [Clostridiales bacterium]|jgi:alpha-tubulin suppressor-like RCC1 family protein|nr:hypothetical protein [Clostridiales bacterium]
MKRLFVFVLALAIFAPAALHANEVNVTIDNVAVDFAGDTPPVIVDGRTLVPVRAVFEHLGFDVDWDPNAQTATLRSADHVVAITIGSAAFTTNDAPHALDVPAQIIGGRTMLPIRAVLESVGYNVAWDGAANAVIISSPAPDDMPAATGVRLAAGRTHSMALRPDGSLWVWGENSFGQLGNGRVTTYSEANVIAQNHDEHAPIRLMGNIIDIAAGDGFSLAVNTNGELFAWGLNDMGQLGDGTNINRAAPVKIMDGVAFVDARGGVAIAITADGTLWRWGNDVTGWGGSLYAPTRVMDNVMAAATSSQHIMMLTRDNRLYGIGGVSVLGIYDGNPNFSPRWPDSPHENQPVHILSNIRAIAASDQTSFAVTTNDRLYGWGPNSQGDVGSGSGEFWINLPVFIMDDVRDVFPGSMAIRNDNSLWVWGDVSDTFAYRGPGADGQTEDWGGTLMEAIVDYGNRPVRLMENALAATGSFSHRLAMDRDLNLFAWGSNQFGQLGTGRANVYEFGEPDEWFTPIYLVQDHNEAIPVRISSVSGQ